jgi:hypothetical protein
MDTGQLTIKIILIIIVVAFSVFLMLPGSGARHLAIRRLLMVVLLLAVVLAVIFPSVVTQFANFLGVGRGTDLLLYGLIIVFIGNSLVTQRRHRKTDREITRLARLIAIREAPDPANAGQKPAQDPNEKL